MKHFKILIFTITLILTVQANADTIDFSDGAGNGLATFQKTIQGTGSAAGAISTFSNPIVDIGSNDFFNLNNGLALGTGGLGSSWQVSFDRDVTLYQYTIDFSEGVKPFDITGPGVNLIGLSNATGIVIPSTPIIFLANQQYTFTLQGTPGFGGLTFLNWDFTSPVILPPVAVPTLSAYNTGLLIILLFFVVLYSRRKITINAAQ